MSRGESFTLRASGGAKLFVYRWVPEEADAVRAAVQIAHGMAEHAGRYEGLARSLNAKGVAVYANDMRGHGRTAATPAELGHLADEGGWGFAVEDMFRLTATIHESHPGLPVFLLGHSMGSLLARDYISSFGGEIDGVLLSGTSGDPGLLGSLGLLIARLECWSRGRRAPSPLLTRLSFGAFNRAFEPAKTAFDWLSRDSAEVDAYVDDPACGFVCSAGFYLDLLSGLRQIHAASTVGAVRKDLPMYLFSGAEDPVGQRGKAVSRVFEAYRRAGLLDVSLRLYEDGRHEMLNELNRQEVYQDVASWIEARYTR
jgi:alpha-beta hydrolase superfamily lysophospholipase